MSDDEIRAPDNVFNETLISNSTDFLENTNYNEDFELNNAIKESMLEVDDDEYLYEQLDFLNTTMDNEQIKMIEDEQIKMIEYEQIKMIEDEQLRLFEDEQLRLFEEEQLKLLEDERIVIERSVRHNSLEGLCVNLLKIRTLDPNLNDYFFLLDLIINDYIECNINDFYVDAPTYNNLLKELSKIRVKDSEIDIITKIILIKQ